MACKMSLDNEFSDKLNEIKDEEKIQKMKFTRKFDI